MTCQGNLLLSRLVGAKMVVFPARTDVPRSQQLREIHEEMDVYAEKLKYAYNVRIVVVPEGTIDPFISECSGTDHYSDMKNV